MTATRCWIWRGKKQRKDGHSQKRGAMKNSAIPMAARQAPVSELLIFAVPIAMSGIQMAMCGIPIAMGLNAM